MPLTSSVSMAFPLSALNWFGQTKMTSACVLLAAVLQTVTGFPSFRALIPNGDSVPDPCTPGSLWQAVGHYDPVGWGDFNPFGNDFESAGFQWTEALCRMDSDYDGKTNGFELGDPNCTWTKDGGTLLKATGNPGICEPLNSVSTSITCASTTITSVKCMLCNVSYDLFQCYINACHCFVLKMCFFSELLYYLIDKTLLLLF
ncbi:hypothetical protein Btru_061338 [Bulinus truncatus]|nr:hypothetical protein Btru_061338 [Bulinus truncatus]